MRANNLLVCLFLFLFAPLGAEEEIVVPLFAQGELTPLYLDTISGSNAGFDNSYLDKLLSILRFDLDSNGKTQTIPKTQKISLQLSKEKGWKNFGRSGWEPLHIPYVVKALMEEQKLSIAVYNVKGDTIHTIEQIPLSGLISEDRSKIHKLSDAIFDALFSTRSIASTSILYTVRRQTGANSTLWQTEIWEADYDGGNPRQITREGHLCVTPCYLPPTRSGHSQQFLYVSYRIGQPKIYIASTLEGIGRRLSYLRGNQLMPTLSPLKNQIAFISDITGNPELFVQPFDLQKGLLDKPRQIFSAPTAAQGSPTFSPSGKEIAFVSNKDGTPRIYIIAIPAPGSSVKEVKPLLITKQNRDNTCPAWSPDGTKIAYSALTRGVRQIWVYDTATGREKQLTEGGQHKENPAWAPDSIHLVYNSSTEKTAELYLININQTKAVKITSGPGEKRFPTWEPAPQ